MTFTRVFGALCLVKSIDLAARLPGHTDRPVAVVVLTVWVCASVAMTAGHVKPAALVLGGCVPVVLAVTSMGMFNQHWGLIGWVSLWLVLLDGEPQRTALRIQLSIVYGFGALAKLNPWFLSGEVLEALPGSRFDLPAEAWMLMSVATVALEGWLAIGLWLERTRAVSIMLGIGLHAGIITAMSTGPISLVRMIVFNGLCLALYLPHLTRSAAPVPSPTAKVPASRW